MYCWNLLTGDISDVPFLMGVTSDLDEAMRICEPYVISGRAFLCYIEAVRPAMTADGLDPCYVRTGRHWIGRRTIHGRVHWEEREGSFGSGLLPAL